MTLILTNDEVLGDVINSHLEGEQDYTISRVDSPDFDFSGSPCGHRQDLIFIDFRDGTAWGRLEDFADRLAGLNRPVALLGIVDQGIPLEHALTASQVLDDCLCWPLDAKQIRDKIDRLPSRPERSSRVRPRLDSQVFGGYGQDSFLTYCPSLFRMLSDMEVAASRNFTVLLVGETGTGKTTLARIIHRLSRRREEPFVTVACGALPAELIDSELFGHVKGSFTGAESNKDGKFAAAGSGTLLLDEIDVLGLPQQAKLLRVLERGEYERIGCNETRIAKARVIAATNLELESLIEQGRFRADLYFRLNVVKFEIPPLRRRRIDIIPLALQFIHACCRDENVEVTSIHPDFIAALQAYSWPGNTRELKHETQRAVLFTRNGLLDTSTLDPAKNMGGRARPETGLAGNLAVSEQAVIEEMLRRQNNNRTATARALGISRVTLYNKIRKYRIHVNSRA